MPPPAIPPSCGWGVWSYACSPPPPSPPPSAQPPSSTGHFDLLSSALALGLVGLAAWGLFNGYLLWQGRGGGVGGGVGGVGVGGGGGGGGSGGVVAAPAKSAYAPPPPLPAPPPALPSPAAPSAPSASEKWAARAEEKGRILLGKAPAP